LFKSYQLISVDEFEKPHVQDNSMSSSEKILEEIHKHCATQTVTVKHLNLWLPIIFVAST